MSLLGSRKQMLDAGWPMVVEAVTKASLKLATFGGGWCWDFWEICATPHNPGETSWTIMTGSGRCFALRSCHRGEQSRHIEGSFRRTRPEGTESLQESGLCRGLEVSNAEITKGLRIRECTSATEITSGAGMLD